METLKERVDFININIEVLNKAKLDLFNERFSDYQKDLNIVNQGLELLIEDYTQKIKELLS